MNLGKFLGYLTPPIAWDFTPEQVFNPNKLTRHLMDGCLAYSDQNQQLLALYWGLACAYLSVVQQKNMTEAETQTIMPKVVIAPVVKKMCEDYRTYGPNSAISKGGRRRRNTGRNNRSINGRRGGKAKSLKSHYSIRESSTKWRGSQRGKRSYTVPESIRISGFMKRITTDSLVNEFLLGCSNAGKTGLVEGHETQQLDLQRS
ncbi:hypothetical protein BTVI_134541 [Pitangus sulphuratus]|nr:hypothetical protein BTVI_134541 [Pitangus sulphuratus]